MNLCSTTRTRVSVATVVGALFLLLLLEVSKMPNMVSFYDLAIAQHLAPLQTFPVVYFFLGVTVLGSTLGIFLVSIPLFYSVRKQRRTIQELLLLLAGTATSVHFIKNFIERARPDSLIWLSAQTEYSFPSGHAAGVTALYGFVALLLYKKCTNSFVKFLGIGFCILIIILVCFSRLILNVHYFSDVVGGVLLAGFWLLLARAIGARK